MEILRIPLFFLPAIMEPVTSGGPLVSIKVVGRVSRSCMKAKIFRMLVGRELIIQWGVLGPA